MATPNDDASAGQQYQLISATYKSPESAPFSHLQKLPAPASTSAADKTSYLSVLRKATAEMQEQINKELTARMEEDKARDASASKVDDVKEEENYGEEGVEEED